MLPPMALGGGTVLSPQRGKALGQQVEAEVYSRMIPTVLSTRGSSPISGGCGAAPPHWPMALLAQFCC